MTIDLHGLETNEATAKILLALSDFQNKIIFELKIITGKGLVLRDLAIELIEEKGLRWKYDDKNTGALNVMF